MRHRMPAAASPEFTAWADAMTAAVLRGQELACLGAPEDQDAGPPASPDSRSGFTLECSDHAGKLVSGYPLDRLTAQDAQQILGDEDTGRMMCPGRAVSGTALAAIAAGRAISADEAACEYVLSPWAGPACHVLRAIM
jgi:hypothetical protein